MKQRSVGIAILLSIITCGIYGIYWLIMLNDETNYVSGHQQDGTSGGVYGYYWCYKQGEKLNEAKMQRGIMIDTSASVIYLVLSIFGLSIVAYALMQSELNKMLPPQ
jgi:Na+/H+ antiporter NhaC